MDIGLDDCRVDAKLAPSNHLLLTGDSYQTLVDGFDYFTPSACPKRPIVFASGTFSAPIRVNIR